MFIEKLRIKKNNQIIRDITFHAGLNLIIDGTKNIDDKEQKTGNNVGKTTVLKLIEYCFGKSGTIIYKDEETNQDYGVVKSYLEDKNIMIELVLTKVLEQDDSSKIVLRRNFLRGKTKIMSINGKNYSNSDDYSNEIQNILFPNLKSNKPTLKQVIAHNFRYKDNRINNTIKHLNQNTTNFEYEALFLYLLGMPVKDDKEHIKQQYNKEVNYKSKLEQRQTLQGYKTMLSSINNDIEKYENIKSEFKLNEDYRVDLNHLNEVKYNINKLKSQIVSNNIKIDLTNETINELQNNKTDIKYQEIKQLYDEAVDLMPSINKKFEDLLNFHNTMIANKLEFYIKQKELISNKNEEQKEMLNQLLVEEETLIDKTNKLFIEEDLEEIIIKLNNLYNDKGEYETFINQIEETEKNIENLAEQIDLINNDIQSEEFKKSLDKKVDKFNEFYNLISEKLYDEKYFLKYDINTEPISRKEYYKFSTFNNNFGSGKKQGEIVSFDIAYILFARFYGLPTLEFICNDKKELMDINQILTVQDILKQYNVQFIFSILREKVSSIDNLEEFCVLELDQENKLFLIENII